MYVKLFSSILTSSVWSEDMPTRLVWITLLALADKDGDVRASPSGLARMANVSPEDCRRALDCFLAPDPESASQAQEGRRLEEREGGWWIINYDKYRTLVDVETRKAQWRESSKGYRQRKSAARQQKSAHTEAEAEAEGNGSKAPKKSGAGDLSPRHHPVHIPVERPAEPPAFDKGTSTATTDSLRPNGAVVLSEPSSVVTRFMARFYGRSTPERRADVARQICGSILVMGVTFKGSLVRAVDPDHLDDACLAVMEDPPRDPNAAWVFVLQKLRDTYLEVLSARAKAIAPPRVKLPDGMAGEAPAGATPIRAAIAGVLDGLEVEGGEA